MLRIAISPYAQVTFRAARAPRYARRSPGEPTVSENRQHGRVDALRALWDAQGQHEEDALVFATSNGTAMTAHNVRRDFRKVVAAAGLDSKRWIPRELRHSFVSLLSDSGLPVENIARLVGHQNTTVTETVYRHQLRPVIADAASAVDRIFPADDQDQGDDDDPAGGVPIPA